MRRRVWMTLVALSLALCMAIAALWFRSHHRWDRFVTRSLAHGAGFGSADGQVALDLKWTGTVDALPEPGWRPADPIRISFRHNLKETLDVPVDVDPLRVSQLRLVYFNPATSFRWDWLDSNPPRWSVTSARPTVGDLYFLIRFPHWLVVSLFAVLPVCEVMRWTASRWRRSRRVAVGRCSVCGYDVRATPGRCPECGTTLMAPAGPSVPAVHSAT